MNKGHKVEAWVDPFIVYKKTGLNKVETKGGAPTVTEFVCYLAFYCYLAF